jgi:hypothetical protein
MKLLKKANAEKANEIKMDQNCLNRNRNSKFGLPDHAPCVLSCMPKKQKTKIEINK